MQMNAQWWQAAAALIAAYAALFAGIYAVVTVPLLRTIESAVEASEARLREKITGSEAGLKTELAEMESRLTQRIADKLNDHGERITRLEERRFR